MDGKRWEPVEDGLAQHTRWTKVGTDGDTLWMEDTEGEGELSIDLPADLRLCRLVDAPAPAAWGPPMAQPDSDGWWAFEGAFRLTPNKPIDVQVIQLVFDDDIGKMHEWYRGTWRKLLVSPWEVQP